MRQLDGADADEDSILLYRPSSILAETSVFHMPLIYSIGQLSAFLRTLSLNFQLPRAQLFTPMQKFHHSDHLPFYFNAGFPLDHSPLGICSGRLLSGFFNLRHKTVNLLRFLCIYTSFIACRCPRYIDARHRSG